MSNAAAAKNWLDRFAALVAELDERPYSDFRALVGAGRARLDAVEARRLMAESGGDTKRAARLAGGDGKTRSKQSARKAARRAAAVAKNPTLADELESGGLSAEQLDTIADAANTDETAANDQALIDAVANSSVDQGRKTAADWLLKRKTQTAVDDEHARQRRLRTARRYNNKRNGLAGIALEGDDTTINQLWRTIRDRERSLYRADGGRNIATSLHERTWEQRHYDAALAVLTGDERPGTSRTRTLPAPVLNIPLAALDGTAVAEAIGDGPAPTEVLIDAIRQAGLRVTITDITGEPLAWGRLKRHATPEQRIALAIRDKGCALCNTDWQHCEIHHITPWHSPTRGETNLNELALLCPNDHHHLHDNHLTLTRNKHGNWTTRPATPNEIALRQTQHQPSQHPPPDQPPHTRHPKNPSHHEHLGKLHPTGTDPP